MATQTMTSRLFDDLPRLRAVGDQPADDAIEYWQRTKNVRNCLHSLADQLVGFEFSPEIERLIDIFSAKNSTAAQALDPRKRIQECACEDSHIADGQKVFEEQGLKILLILLCYSLPAAYAAQNGVRVLHSDNGSTGFFIKDHSRRLIETAQFIIEVFSDKGLRIEPERPCGEQGRAIRSALRVRLLHAVVRALVESNGARGGKPWNTEEFGRPANQEDLSGTLMTFSWLVIDGLRKLHLNLDSNAEQAYLEIWMRVGKVLGVQRVPSNLEEAEALTIAIRKSQIDAPILANVENLYGKEMTRRLIEFFRSVLPWYLRWLRLPEALIRFFLPTEPDVPASLGIRPTPILLRFVKIWFCIEAKLTNFTFFRKLNDVVFVEWDEKDPRAITLLQFSRNIGRRLLRGMQGFDRNAAIAGGQRQSFQLHGWERRWALKQANPLTRVARRLRTRVTGTQYQPRP